MSVQLLDPLQLEVDHGRTGLLRLKDREKRILDSGAQSAQLLDDRESGIRRVRFGISAFVTHREPSGAQAPGGVEHQLRHFPKCFGMQQLSRQRVDRIRVEPTRDHDDLGTKAFQRRHDNRANGGKVSLMAATSRQRNVDVAAHACAFTAFIFSAVSGRKASILVHGDSEHIVATVIDVLCTVAMMNIPVHHGNPLHAEFHLQRFDGNRDVGEQAESCGVRIPKS